MLKYTPIDASHVCNISCTHTAYMQHSVAKAIFGCDLRDFQYTFFLVTYFRIVGIMFH